MEQRLRKERNKLFARIILIMLAVWLTVSSVYCAAFLNVERERQKNQQLSDLTELTQLLNLTNGNFESIDEVFLKNFDLLYDEKKGEKNSNAQILITAQKTNKVIVDTSKSIIGVHFYLKWRVDSTMEAYGLIDYDTIRKALSDKQYNRIKKYLASTRKDGNYYELVCTKCRFENMNIIPLELKIKLIDGKDNRFVINDNVEVYDLSSNAAEGEPVYESSGVERNTIVTEFLVNKIYNEDLIASMTDKQKKESSVIVPKGPFEDIFYVTNYLGFNGELYANADDDVWTIQYAKKINLIETCRNDLVIGVSLIFGFFLTIAVVFCVMIWNRIKHQIVEEYKRIEFTNALAHDIKTPLFVISGYASSLREDIDIDERDKYLDKILEQTEDINALVHRMLDFSKLDSYNIKPNYTEFSLLMLVQDVVKNYINLPDGKTLNVTVSVDSNINADKELVKQALENLIENAVNYSVKESVIEINVDGKSLTISNACDNLTKSDIKNLTQPYFRKDKSRNQKGNGLGLSIVKSIFELNKAKFSIKLKNNIISFRVNFL